MIKFGMGYISVFTEIISNLNHTEQDSRMNLRQLTKVWVNSLIVMKVE